MIASMASLERGCSGDNDGGGYGDEMENGGNWVGRWYV